MGFHKRFLTKDKILNSKSFKDIKILLSADALILDSWSSNFLDKFDKNYDEYQKKRFELIEETKLSSSSPDTSSFDKSNLSNVLINLKTEPNWLDIKLCIEYFRSVDIPTTIAGNFESMCNFCINLIETELDK